MDVPAAEETLVQSFPATEETLVQSFPATEHQRNGCLEAAVIVLNGSIVEKEPGLT
jgi:hypothetical protein